MDESPAALRAAVLLIAVEAAAVAVLALVLLYQDLTGAATSLGAAIAVTVFAGGWAAALAGLASLLHRRRGGARGVTIVLHLMAVPVAYYAIRGGQAWYGVPALVVALAVCALLVTPATTRALGLADRGRGSADTG